MSRMGLILFAITYLVFYSGTSYAKFEVIIENITECQNPQPPFIKKPIFISNFKIYKRGGGITYLSGQNKVLAEVPFLNYSVHSFIVDASGAQRPVLHVDKVNCRSWKGKLFLTSSGFRYNSSNCRINKGTYSFSDLDLNKMAHAIPNWHAAGRQLHKSVLVFNGSTIFCQEIVLLINEFE